MKKQKYKLTYIYIYILLLLKSFNNRNPTIVIRKFKNDGLKEKMYLINRLVCFVLFEKFSIWNILFGIYSIPGNSWN
jgi:hypothetical protein